MLLLPYRSGRKPQTTSSPPHQQLDQNPPAEIYASLQKRAFSLPHVDRRPSLVSVPGAEALWLTELEGDRRAEAFLRDNEFAHVHPPNDGSMHMMLPEEDVRELFEKGWGEPHPEALAGNYPVNAVMVYGPRDEAELEVIMQIISSSYQLARGN